MPSIAMAGGCFERIVLSRARSAAFGGQGPLTKQSFRNFLLPCDRRRTATNINQLSASYAAATSAAAFFKSATNCRYAARLSVSSSMRKSDDGCTVTNSLVPSVSASGLPRTLAMVSVLPVRLRAAVTPSAITAEGFISLRSSSSQILQRSISSLFGRLCSRRLPRISCLKCLTALVTNVWSCAISGSASAWSSMRPAGPTNGLPARSSLSPGCSPTSMKAARLGPSPGTAWVASLYSGQRVQTASAAASWRSEVIDSRFLASIPGTMPTRPVRFVQTRTMKKAANEAAGHTRDVSRPASAKPLILSPSCRVVGDPQHGRLAYLFREILTDVYG